MNVTENRPATWPRIVRSAWRACIAVASVLALAAGSAQASHTGGPHGDNFGAVPVNDGAGPAQDVPAFPDRNDPQTAGNDADYAIWAGTCDLFAASTSNGGVGTPPAAPSHCIDHGYPNVQCPVATGCNPMGPITPPTWRPGSEPAWRLDPASQAAAHPDATATMWLNRSSVAGAGRPQPDGDPKDILVKLPPGVVGNPRALPKCSSEALSGTVLETTCPPETQVGMATISLMPHGTAVFPIYNVEPRRGNPAEFIIQIAGVDTIRSSIPIVAKLRPGDYGIDTMAIQVPSGVPVLGQTITLWGAPWASSHDRFRPPVGYSGHTTELSNANVGMPLTGLAPGDPVAEPQSYDPSWGPIRPFMTNPTECAPSAPVTRFELNSWHNLTVRGYDVPADSVVTGCDAVPFAPDISITPTSSAPDSASGLVVDMEVPQHNDPPADVATNPDDASGAPNYWRSNAGTATAQLDKAVVTLPPGVSVNPSASTGLEGCSDAQLGLGNDERPTCPDGSRIGTVEVQSPLLEETLTGHVFLREPRSTDPTSGQMFRMAIVAGSEERGVRVKIAGSAVANPLTGQLTATFDDNPRLTFETLRLHLKGGPRGVLAMPQRCGAHPWSSLLSPWTAEHGAGGTDMADGAQFAIAGDCSFGFAPSLRAGMDQRQGGATGRFAFQIARNDGQQWLSGVTAQLPSGLLASVRGVPLCGNAQANANACPPASRIGYADAAAGSGTPFVLERPGSVYLTEGYKGGEYGLAVSVPVEAGPFRGPMALSPIVVRQALHVDRRTAAVTAISDPLPLIHHGIPLRTRQVTVVMDRPGFMRNPSDCSPKQIAATITSAEGAVSNLAQPFRATGCAAMPFKPKLTMRLTGKRQITSNRHPGVRARVTQRPGEAGIRRAEVRLPKTLALDPDNAEDLCEFVDGTKPDLENHCPKGSIVGRARAVSPMLNRPLSGPVFFVKNVRIDPDTGAPRRTLPMIVAALRGEISINLRGESDVKGGGKLVNTFEQVPDAPISRFDLRIAGGSKGILVVTESTRGRLDICGRQIAEADIDGQNGRRYDRDVRIKTPCSKRKSRLRLRKAVRSGSRVVVKGRIARAAKRRVRVTLRCAGARVSRMAKPNKRGVFKRALPARRCRSARGRVVARYAGEPRVAKGRAVKRVRL